MKGQPKKLGQSLLRQRRQDRHRRVFSNRVGTRDAKCQNERDTHSWKGRHDGNLRCWRAVCSESCTHGSGRGGRKRSWNRTSLAAYFIATSFSSKQPGKEDRVSGC